MTTPPTAPSTIPTRFLLLSDTHNRIPTPTSTTPFRLPLPSSTVLLHAGDLTMTGGAEHYRALIRWLATSDAELKIVIAGNHDVDLDEGWERGKGIEGKDGERERKEGVEREIREAREVWTSEEAVEAGIVYLEEGVREFGLRSGARFTIYTSPYQPEYCGWAFAYNRHTDRFNPSSSSSSSPFPPQTPILLLPFPTPEPHPPHPAIDIILTHGPPYSIRDRTSRGENVGCEHLLKALSRARPRLCVFGHIHEGWGGERIVWGDQDNHNRDHSHNHSHKNQNQDGEEDKRVGGGNGEGDKGVAKREPIEIDKRKAREEGGVFVDLTTKGGRPLEWGKETVCVNAAVVDLRYRPVHPLWVVDLELGRR
ncbi:hypothetical protein G7Y79_00006g019220 [Physcia stellaris]|nr:hypothetical protein G7Y79_00006g019220 [Physcia stellaris]